MPNIFQPLPSISKDEFFEVLAQGRDVKIEKIVSKGQVTPKGEWLEGKQDEWVLVLAGAARLSFKEGRVLDLKPGDYVNIPANIRHRVEWTDPKQKTVWLAVHYLAS